MFKGLVTWFKWKVAGKELWKLEKLNLRIRMLHDWCNYEHPQVGAAAKWLLDQEDYPCQFKGAKGDIDDFREYLRKQYPLSKLSEETIKEIATEFFYKWYNSPGNNTQQGFDDWWAENRERWVTHGK